MNFSEVIQSRRSIKSYDPGKAITLDELKELFRDVVLSPSSFNLQHWTFIAATDPEQKKKLRAAAWDQPQVEDCSVALVVCGKLTAYKDVAHIYEETPKEVQDQVVPMVGNFYEGNDPIIRDEAIRSASLAAMTLMFAARDRGWDTGPMIGFDPKAVSELVHLTADYIPVMLLVLGYRSKDPRPRAYRRPLSEVVRIDTLDGSGLE